MTNVKESSRQSIRRALDGDSASIHALVAELTPVIQARVARALLRRRSAARGADVRQALDDLVQDVLVHLFRDDGKALRAWDPARGMGLAGFVGMVADQHVAWMMRAQKRNPWAEELDDRAGEDAIAPADDPEIRAASREELEQLLARMDAELTPLGRDLFERLLIEEEPIASVATATGMSVAAVQAWSSRLKRLAVRVSAEGGSRRAEGGS